MLADIGCNDGIAGSMPGKFFNHPLRLDHLVVHLVTERMNLSPFFDLPIPILVQAGKMLRRSQVLDFLIQPGQDVLGVAYDRDVHLDILLNARRINVNVNDLGMLGKLIDLSGSPIVKAGAHSDQQITLGYRIIGIPRPVHSQHAQELRVFAGKPAQSQKRVGHRDAGILRQLFQFFISA